MRTTEKGGGAMRRVASRPHIVCPPRELPQWTAATDAPVKIPDRAGPGIIVLDRRGQVAFANDLASAILRARELLQDRDGELRAGSQQVTNALQAAISKAVALPHAAAPKMRNVVLLPRAGRMPLVTMT